MTHRLPTLKSQKGPRTRGECVAGPRPCPWYSCRHHLGNDAHLGPVRVREITEEPSCSLDVASDGELPLDRISALLGVWHTHVETTYAVAIEKLRKKLESEYGDTDAKDELG